MLLKRITECTNLKNHWFCFSLLSAIQPTLTARTTVIESITVIWLYTTSMVTLSTSSLNMQHIRFAEQPARLI